MSLIFQNIDPPPPSLPVECVPPAYVGGGGHTRQAERGGGGSIVWKTRDIGLPSYSNNLSTYRTYFELWDHGRRNFKDTNPLMSSLLVIFVGVVKQFCRF